MDEYKYTTADLAAEFGVKSRTVLNRAKPLGIGILFGRRGGWRYTEADRQRLIESLRPAEPVRRRRRRAA